MADQVRFIPGGGNAVLLEVNNVQRDSSNDSGQESMKELTECQNPKCVQQRNFIHSLSEGRSSVNNDAIRSRQKKYSKQKIAALFILTSIALVTLSCIPLIVLLQSRSAKISSTGNIVVFDGQFDPWLRMFKLQNKNIEGLNSTTYHTSNYTYLKDLMPSQLDGAE